MPYKDPEQQREYQNRWMKQRRLDWLAEHGPCVDCGTWEDLQVDHVDARLKVSHRVWSWRQEKRDAELAKCVARCDPCHKKKTTESGERPWGERNGCAKLTEAQVLHIRASDLPHRHLARIYSVDEKTIRLLRLGETWQRT